jgi:hypothetical protein
VTEFVARLSTSKKFLNSLVASGGDGQIIIQFLGDGYYGDTLPQTTLVKIADLGLGLGLEVYPTRQNPHASRELS